jgi:hypothetical protein
VALRSGDKNAQVLVGSAQMPDQGSQDAQLLLPYLVKSIGGTAGTPSYASKQINGTPMEYAAAEVTRFSGSQALLMVETAYVNGRLYVVIGVVDRVAASTVRQDVSDLLTILNSMTFASSSSGSGGKV